MTKFPYTAHEVLSKEIDIEIRMNEIKKALSRIHPDKKVTFDLSNDLINIDGLFTLKYTIL